MLVIPQVLSLEPPQDFATFAYGVERLGLLALAIGTMSQQRQGRLKEAVEMSELDV